MNRQKRVLVYDVGLVDELKPRLAMRGIDTIGPTEFYTDKEDISVVLWGLPPSKLAKMDFQGAPVVLLADHGRDYANFDSAVQKGISRFAGRIDREAPLEQMADQAVRYTRASDSRYVSQHEGRVRPAIAPGRAPKIQEPTNTTNRFLYSETFERRR